MVTLADSLLSSSARKLSIRKRADLVAQKQRYEGETYYVIKDPVGLNYFRFQEEEFFILNQLDGQSSLDEIKARFEAEFPPQKITLEELQQFVGMLHRSGLVVAVVPEQGRQLLKRRRERRKRELLSALGNILAIRFRGIDPERILTAMYPWVRWVFHPAFLIACVVLWIAALLLIASEFRVFLNRLPTFHQFFTPTNALWLALTLAVTKIIHEFGHGLSCKHFGGECHEMGIMLLVLTPCLYCNVSDSWMLPNRWHRAAIGAAGIFVELTLAALATFIWWFSEPGLINHLALNVMFICSVSTLVFNGNPLLRYDGYYVLADILEIPNLRQKATQLLSRTAAHWFLGIKPPDDPFLPQRNRALFVLYA
ncbi:MAG TPA: hemolysin D, partial [Thermogutta sp.]|nr:hemolysin D [Thermogutta sp.]